MSAKPIGDQALIDDLRVQLAAIVVGSNPGFMMYGDPIPTQAQVEVEIDAQIAEYEGELAAGLPLGYHQRARRARRARWAADAKADRHRRRWGRRLQRLVERPINAIIGLVNRLGGDMYFDS